MNEQNDDGRALRALLWLGRLTYEVGLLAVFGATAGVLVYWACVVAGLVAERDQGGLPFMAGGIASLLFVQIIEKLPQRKSIKD